MEQGQVEKKIIEQCMRENLPLPDKIANAPVLLEGLDLYYEAFQNLVGDRGSAELPISWLAIHTYCRQFDLSEEQEQAMHHHIKEMDSVYLKVREKKSK